MRISRKIGISFFITFLLVILLGTLSIYSLRQVYRGLNQVFVTDLPASRATFQIAISMENMLTELNNFLITGNENFKIKFEKAHKKLQEDLSSLKKFILKDDEKGLFEEVSGLVKEIYDIADSIFDKKDKIESSLNDINGIGIEYQKKLDALLSFEQDKMLQEKDFLLIQAQHLPSSNLIIDASIRFSDLLNKVALYAMAGQSGRQGSLTEDLLLVEKSIMDYKNYYAYTLSDKERALASELGDSSEGIKSAIGSIVSLKNDIDADRGSLLGKEKNFMESLEKLIGLKKSEVSSKLGVAATLTEDIPAIYNISKLKKDIAESWRASARYILTGDENYKNLYYQLRQGIDKDAKDYGRHARLRAREELFNSVMESDKDILEAIRSNINVFEKKEETFVRLDSLKEEIKKKIDELLGYNDSLIKQGLDKNAILEKHIPARWALLGLKNGFSGAYRLVSDYLNQNQAQYKDEYSQSYFDMKKYVNRFRNLASSDKEMGFIKDIEMGLDDFNKDALDIIGSHDAMIKETGWTLVKLQDAMNENLDKALEAELSQIQANREDIKKRIAVVNVFIFVIIGVVAVIAVFVIFYTTKSITNPIQKLYEGAEVIGRGNLDHRLDIKTGDEIQDLAEGFNTMASELKELYTNLENKVKERTAQLAEANKLLGLKNKELDDFTYIVSHDLKEPLRGVKAFTKLLMEDYADRFDKEGKEHLKTISDSNTRMTRLIEDLLNLSRIGRIKNIEKDVDLNEVLSDVKKNLHYSLEEKSVDLKISGDFPKVTCDRIRISEVFSNLISNAVKYSRKGIKPVIELGYSDKGDFYEFYVKDNGIGIEKQYYDKVFQIFQRLHAKDEYEGTGAGLTIVKKIIENHGGRIWVESEVGVGSTFYFTLSKHHNIESTSDTGDLNGEGKS